MSDRSLPLVNVYEVETGGLRRHLVCLLDPVLGGIQGIDSRSVIGEFKPSRDGGFDHETFQVNPEFIAAFTQFMNETKAGSPEVRREAWGHPSEWVYYVDPRASVEPASEPPPSDVVGCFAVDDSGQVVPGSFQYNRNHAWFDPTRGISGVLADRAFHDWLNRPADRRGLAERGDPPAADDVSTLR